MSRSGNKRGNINEIIIIIIIDASTHTNIHTYQVHYIIIIIMNVFSYHRKHILYLPGTLHVYYDIHV